MSYVSHDGLAYFKHKLDQKFISNITSEDGALKIVLGDGTVLKSIQDTTVTQKKSTANELYPLLLCYDAMADQDQFSKETWFGQHILANPYYGYLASRGMYVKHPTFNRRNGVSQKVEWAYDFTDAVSGLGNPMSQVYAYVDPASEGGEHCIELRLYGNPNVSPTVPSVNDSTNTFSIGVGVTGGNVQFGYCPSTPLYLDNNSTLRTEATGHGNDIITRDWLNLNGSLTGLVHTTMNETIDGAKTFKKTVTINSGDNNNKAGLYVQGNSDVHGNEHVYGTETVDGKLTANGTAEIKGGSGNTPSLTVTGNEKITGNSTVDGNSNVGGNSTITGNETVGGNISTTNGNISTTNGTVSGKTGSIGSGGLTVAGTTTSTGKITGNGGAEISGGSGLKVNGNETVTGNIVTNGTITKVVNNTPVEYVTYITNQPEAREAISENIISLGNGLSKDTNGKIYVDFNQMPTDKFEALMNQLHLPLWVGERNGASNIGINFYVNGSTGIDKVTDGYGRSADKPWKTLSYATLTLAKNYNISTYSVRIFVAGGTYAGPVYLTKLQATTGSVSIIPLTANDVVKIESDSSSGQNNCFIHSGGNWQLHNLHIKLTVGVQPNSSTRYYAIVSSSSNDDPLTVLRCTVSFVDNTVPVDSDHGTVYLFGFSSNGGKLRFGNNSWYAENTVEGHTSYWSGTKNNANVYWIEIENGGLVHFNCAGTGNEAYHFNVSGSFNVFLNVNTNGIYRLMGEGPTPDYVYNIAEIGRGSRGYNLRTGANVTPPVNNVTDRENYFPRGYTTDENSTTPVSNYCATSELALITPVGS